MTQEFQYTMESMRLISSFQTLELSLKLYICAAYQIIRAKLEGAIPFRYNYKTIKNYPLEKLLTIFAQLNSNTDLQTRLNQLRVHRNQVAHQAFILRHEVIRDLLGEDLEKNHSDLSAAFAQLDQCLIEMGAELDRIMKINAQVAA